LFSIPQGFGWLNNFIENSLDIFYPKMEVAFFSQTLLFACGSRRFDMNFYS
jgi:hypothetical protein